MSLSHKQSKANYIWLLTFTLILLALALETRPPAVVGKNMKVLPSVAN